MRLLSCFFALLITTAHADEFCKRQVDIRYDVNHFGIVMQMRVKDPLAIEMLHDLLPYGDCYQGVCTAKYSYETQEYIVNFTKKMSNGYKSAGRVAKYTTFGTDNGTWLSIETENESDSFLFKGCY